MSENWRPVVGQEGFYEVSDLGRVRSIDRVFVRADGQRQGRRGRLLSPTPTGRGYPSVQLRHGSRRPVHALVCEAFHGSPPTPRHEVAHFDGDKLNNTPANLRWATQRENHEDSIRHGAVGITAGEGGERNGHARLTWGAVDEIRRLHAAGETQAALAAAFGVGKSQVHNIVAGKSWREEWRP